MNPNAPAFPQTETTNRNFEYPQNGYEPDVHSTGGMTKREYMATHILAGLCANTNMSSAGTGHVNVLTPGGSVKEMRYPQAAVALADALAKALGAQ